MWVWVIVGRRRIDALRQSKPLSFGKAMSFILRAAALVGSTMSDFVIRASLESAKQVLENHSSITLQSRYFDSFITTCENPPEHTQALKAALAVTHESGIE